MGLLDQLLHRVARHVIDAGGTILQPKAWPAGCRQLVLSFDDGPTTEHAVTERLLDVLGEHRVPAMFCVIGSQLPGNEALVQRALDEGHAVANHTQSHHPAALFSTRRMEAEILGFEQTWRDCFGAAAEPPVWFRPPMGVRSAPVERAVRRYLLCHTLLTFFVNDANTTPSEAPATMAAIRREVERSAGAALVLHERRHGSRLDKSWLPRAVDDLIRWARAEGYTFTRYRRPTEPTPLPGAAGGSISGGEARDGCP